MLGLWVKRTIKKFKSILIINKKGKMTDLLTMYQVYTFPFSKIHGSVANKEYQDEVFSTKLECESKKKNSKIRREPGNKNQCKTLEISAENYTTHCWRHSAATNLADRGISFINLKRHSQWKSDSVVDTLSNQSDVDNYKLVRSFLCRGHFQPLYLSNTKLI